MTSSYKETFVLSNNFSTKKSTADSPRRAPHAEKGCITNSLFHRKITSCQHQWTKSSPHSTQKSRAPTGLREREKARSCKARKARERRDSNANPTTNNDAIRRQSLSFRQESYRSVISPPPYLATLPPGTILDLSKCRIPALSNLSKDFSIVIGLYSQHLIGCSILYICLRREEIPHAQKRTQIYPSIHHSERRLQPSLRSS